MCINYVCICIFYILTNELVISDIEFPCDVKVIISVVNPEHLKLPVFASIVMDQFKLGAGGEVDEERIVQYILGKRGGVSVSESASEAVFESSSVYVLCPPPPPPAAFLSRLKAGEAAYAK